MEVEKFRRSVTLICPTCGSDQFEYDGDAQLVEHMKCGSCQREFTREQLIEENSENVLEHAAEMKSEIVEDVKRELCDSLRKAFSGSKSIKLR